MNGVVRIHESSPDQLGPPRIRSISVSFPPEVCRSALV